MKVLITGGSGLVGQEISDKLYSRGDEVRWLSRKEDLNARYKRYKWDIQNDFIDDKALEGIDAVIHLAGKSVGDGRWTDTAKKEILESRTKSTHLLMGKINSMENPPKTVVCASAIGFYGDQKDKTCDENSGVGNDFLADVVNQWETEQQKLQRSRLVQLRIGVVLTEKGGALPKMMIPIKFGVGSPIGDGQQWISWISLRDLSNLFIYSIDNTEVQGIINAVAPNPVTNEQLTKAIGTKLNRPVFLPNVPGFVLKTILGESASLVLSSTKVVSVKEVGYKYVDQIIDDALKEPEKCC
ncbi:TIGR01777 family oxidoreductase [Flammeovirga agarivorans]|uniref:TIGR01777 family protein n=1 Tax=Flammeovirga agarivorans TaxID=2726742 RepID=A0A7X8SQT3_9BACT|nr:TIGR01777 family oxidoreductase [Flammeovirga agarivorans]NLR94675.1 TIGR01777 family protein [Flammeovirga agarivorans]